jgi:AcrR family transcriptional regulator
VKKASKKKQRADSAAQTAAQRAKGPPATAKSSTSERIVRSAAHLFATLGFAHTSMPAIAKRSGITPGAIYRHFESKAELLIAVVRYALETLPTSVRMLEPAQIDASDLPEFAASYTSPGHKLIRQLSLEIHAAGSREQNVMKLLAKVNEEAAQATRRSIAAAQDAGHFSAALNPDFTARFFLVMIMGLSHMDTLEPRLIGDAAWHDFVLGRISALLECHPQPRTKAIANHNHAAAGNEAR